MDRLMTAFLLAGPPWAHSQGQVLQPICWQWFQCKYKHTWTVFSTISTGLTLLGLEVISALSIPVLKLFSSPPQLHQHLKTRTDKASNHQQPVAGGKHEPFIHVPWEFVVKVPVNWKPSTRKCQLYRDSHLKISVALNIFIFDSVTDQNVFYQKHFTFSQRCKKSSVMPSKSAF